MTIEEMRTRKRELGYSNETLAALSGVPLGTVQKVLGGITKAPRQATLEALARVLKKQNVPTEDLPVRYPHPTGDSFSFREMPEPYGVARKDQYTIEDVYALPDGVRAELMDGKLYFMATPSRTHQKIVGELHLTVANYIKAHGGSCEVYIPPFGVFLYGDESTYVEPDLTVVCDSSKLDEKGCWGAPDWVVEVLSPSTGTKDMGKKYSKYRSAGVREYWMIHPEKKVVIVYGFSKEEDKESAAIYSFDDEITCGIYPELKIRPRDLLWPE